MSIANPETSPEFEHATVSVLVVAALMKPSGSKTAEVRKGFWFEGEYILGRLEQPTPKRHLNWALGKGTESEIAEWVIPVAEAEVPAEVYDAVVRGDFDALEELSEIPALDEAQEILFAEAKEILESARNSRRFYVDWRTGPPELEDDLL